MGLPSTPYFLYFHYFGPTTAHSHFSTSYIAHGLIFLFFQAPLSLFTSSRPICLSHGPVIHYSCHLGLMGFLSVCQFFSVRVAGLLPSIWASEMAINKDEPRYSSWNIVPFSVDMDRMSHKIHSLLTNGSKTWGLLCIFTYKTFIIHHSFFFFYFSFYFSFFLLWNSSFICYAGSIRRWHAWHNFILSLARLTGDTSLAFEWI